MTCTEFIVHVWMYWISLFTQVILKSYCTHFLYSPARISWLDCTTLFRPLCYAPLSLHRLYEPKWRDIEIILNILNQWQYLVSTLYVFILSELTKSFLVFFSKTLYRESVKNMKLEDDLKLCKNQKVSCFLDLRVFFHTPYKHIETTS